MWTESGSSVFHHKSTVFSLLSACQAESQCHCFGLKYRAEPDATDVCCPGLPRAAGPTNDFVDRRSSKYRQCQIERKYHCAMPPHLLDNGGSIRIRFSMSWVSIKTGLTAPDGSEEELTEYLCDYPKCPNFATRMVGCLVELRVMAAVCEEHASTLRRPE